MIQAGIYRHYKGPLYQVLGLAHDANAEDLYELDAPHEYAVLSERIVVVYFGLQLDAAHEGPRLAVRTLEDFTALLHTSDYSVCPGGDHCSHRVARFQWLGHTFEKGMLR